MVAYLPLSRTVFIAIAQQSLNTGFKAKLTGLILKENQKSRKIKGSASLIIKKSWLRPE